MNLEFLEKIIKLYRSKALQKKFTRVYSNNYFGGTASKSGEGSGLKQTGVIRREIPILLKKFHLKSLIDAPCGDFFWMKDVASHLDSYVGIDIVEEVIQNNKTKYTTPGRAFITSDLITDKLPKADIIICRDCLVHLSYHQSFNIIINFKTTGSKYLLTTTFTGRFYNENLGKKFWRTLNLELPPFNFPKPIEIINEECSEDNNNYKDKCLGLWLLEDIDTKKLGQ